MIMLQGSRDKTIRGAWIHKKPKQTNNKQLTHQHEQKTYNRKCSRRHCQFKNQTTKHNLADTKKNAAIVRRAADVKPVRP